MKVAILSASTSIHTIQWVKYLAEQGLDIHVISQHAITPDWPQEIPITLLPYKGFIGYFLNAPALKKLLKDIQPDLLNVHFASGYGTTARLTKFTPYVLSVWGSDVYDFPYKSFFHKYLIRKNLLSANVIASTSNCMAVQTKNLLSHYDRTIFVTPFGVNPSIFAPKLNDSEYITIGTVKTLSDKYGIDTLIQSFSLLRNRLKKSNNSIYKLLKLRIVGGGPQELKLKNLVRELEIDSVTEFVGQVVHSQVPCELSKLDIYVALSRLDSESFGVAIVEAQSVGIPVVVSSVGGLPEVVKDNITGLVVEKEDPLDASEALEKLVLNEELRLKMGRAGREHVMKEYDWVKCAEKMLQVYNIALRDMKN